MNNELGVGKTLQPGPEPLKTSPEFLEEIGFRDTVPNAQEVLQLCRSSLIC
jgi:hypothetical protein